MDDSANATQAILTPVGTDDLRVDAGIKTLCIEAVAIQFSAIVNRTTSISR